MEQSYSDAEWNAVKRLIASLVLSLALILGGVAWTWHVGQQSNRLFHQVNHLEEEREGMQASWTHREVRQP